MTKTKVPNPIRLNHDLGEGWTRRVDEEREKTDEVRDGANIINPLEDAAYCDSKKNKKYWEQMGHGAAAKEFQDYAASVKCARAKRYLFRQADQAGWVKPEAPPGSYRYSRRPYRLSINR